MANSESSEDWKIYWKINVLFHTTFLAKGKFKCMWCDKEEISTSLMRSDFALSVVKCSAGHVPAFDPESMIGVCFDCDAELVQRVTERGQKCFQKECRRYALVQKDHVIRRLGKTTPVEEEGALEVPKRGGADLLRRYLALVDKHRVFDCEVCYCEEIAPEQYVELQTTSKCQHDPRQCLGCLKKDIEGRINAGQWRTITCPSQDCDEELTPREVDKFVSPEVFKAYIKEKTFETLSRNPKYRPCHDSKCCNGQIVDVKTSDPHWKCSRCGKLSCFLCKEAGHPGETCEQSQKLNPHREEVEATIRKNCKRCPKKGCRRYIHKITGCTHMTCAKSGLVGCGSKFCWKCKVIFPIKNSRYEYRHLSGCPMVAGTYEAKGETATIERPEKGDPQYEEAWSEDPDYEAGDSGTESWV